MKNNLAIVICCHAIIALTVDSMVVYSSIVLLYIITWLLIWHYLQICWICIKRLISVKCNHRTHSLLTVLLIKRDKSINYSVPKQTWFFSSKRNPEKKLWLFYFVVNLSFKKPPTDVGWVPTLSTHSYKSKAINVPLPARSMLEILTYDPAGSTQTYKAQDSGVILDRRSMKSYVSYCSVTDMYWSVFRGFGNGFLCKKHT